MLTITSGAKTHLEGSITNVTFEIQINWSGSTYTDESAYLHSVNIQKKIEDKHLGPVANTFNITVDNTSGRFSWPSESTRTPKKKIKIYADINGEDVLVLTGVIDTLEQRRDGTALIKGRDLSAIAIDTPAPQKTYVNQSPEAIINDLWTTATGYTTSSDATGITMDFMNFKSESSVWAAISSICKKTVGRVNVLPDGTLKYESLIGKNYTPKSAADWNCGTDDFDSISEQLSTKDIINAVIVSYKNKQVDEDKAAYMLLSDPEGNSVQQDEDERLINWNIGEILAERHRAPSDGIMYLKCGNISSITSVMNDTTSTDITAYASITDAAKGKVTLSSGFSEGDEIRFKYKVSEMKLAINYGYTPAEGWTFEGEVANPTLSYEFGTGSATITLDDDPDPLLYPDADAVISISSITSGATLTKLWIVGDVAVARIEKFKKFDNTSITVYGRRELHLELEGVSIDNARKVAQRIVDRYKDPSSTSDLSITMHPELDILDVINVYDNIHTNLNMGYEIESLNISYASGEAKCNVQLRQYDSVAWSYTDDGITVTAPWDVKKPLTTPVFVDTAVTQESITVTWERQFAAINHMLVLKQGTSTIQTAYTSGNNYTFGSLSANTEYTIELTVIGKDGVTYTNSTSATTLAEVAIGDGVAPAVPTGLDLSTFFSGGKTYVKAAWSANSETDIKGYEVAWSYDGTNYYNSGLTTEISLTIETKSGTTVYVKVRAKDIEGFESAWCTADSITSAGDTTVPADATAINATGGFDIIYIYWSQSKPSDFSHYVLERSPSPYSSWAEIAVVQSKEFIDKNVAAGTYYKYRVKAYDIYGNSATNWVATTSGVTCSSISSELLELDGRLSNLSFSDLLGYLNSGQIDDDTIIARMILAGEIKTLHMDVDEIVANSAWFGKIVANHIATNAITADKILAGEITANKLEALLKIASGKAIQAGPDNDNYSMLSTGFERTKEFPAKVYTVELKLRFLYLYSGLGFYIKYAFYDKTTWDGYYSGTSNFRIQATSGDENTWQEITLRSNMPEFFNWGYQAVGTSLEDFRIALLIESDQGFKFSEADFFINGVHIGGLHTQSEWQNAENTLVSENTSYGPDDGGYMSCTVYYQDLSTAFGISESSTNLSKIVPTILNSGEVLFDGTETSKLVCFGLELAPSQYEVVLIPTQQEISKTTWTPDTHNYKMHLDCRKAQESPYGWFWLDYYVEEYSSNPNVYHDDSAELTSTYQTLFVGGSTMTSAEVSVFHWGNFNLFKQRAWHQYASAGARTVQAKVVSGITYINWGDGSVSEIDTFGAVHIRNIIEYRSASTTKPLTGKVNWILFQT